MNIDIVTAFNSDYITINPKDRNHFSIKMGNGLPYVAEVNSRNEEPFSMLPLLAKVIIEHPDFILKRLTIRGKGEERVVENKTLRELLNPNEINELFAAYQEGNRIFKQYQKDELAYRRGERETPPYRDKPSWVDRKDALFVGKEKLDELCAVVENQLIRQHSTHPFKYLKGNGLPYRTYLDGRILRIAEEDATANHGHSNYSFDEYEVTDIENISLNGGEIIFPIRRVSLKDLGTKNGNGNWAFAKAFYNA